VREAEMRCARCRRELANGTSIERGMGPTCAAKAGRRAEIGGELWEGQPVLDGVGTLEEVGLVCRRLADGRLATNVPHVVKHHSLNGFECWDGGSGSAELALNVAHFLLPPTGSHMDRVYGGVVVSNDAARLHQKMKWDLIAMMPESGGRIPIEDLREWIALKLTDRVAA